MLRALEIRDMLIIERLNLAFRPGLNVLTGETGAGKSILLDSLGFVLGWRGRAELVRSGAERGEVTAVFELPPSHPAHAILAEAGIEVCGGAADAETLLALVEAERPDVAVVDIRMPPTNTDEGLVAAAAIRARFPQTGGAACVQRAHARRAGTDSASPPRPTRCPR